MYFYGTFLALKNSLKRGIAGIRVLFLLEI